MKKGEGVVSEYRKGVKEGHLMIFQKIWWALIFLWKENIHMLIIF